MEKFHKQNFTTSKRLRHCTQQLTKFNSLIELLGSEYFLSSLLSSNRTRHSGLPFLDIIASIFENLACASIPLLCPWDNDSFDLNFLGRVDRNVSSPSPSLFESALSFTICRAKFQMENSPSKISHGKFTKQNFTSKVSHEKFTKLNFTWKTHQAKFHMGENSSSKISHGKFTKLNFARLVPASGGERS